MRFFSILFLSVFLSFSSYSKDFGVNGKIWLIKEKNIISYIKNELEKKDINKFNEDFKKRVTEFVERPRDVENITNATENNIFYFDPTIILSKDIKDHEGNILHYKGKKINPLDHMDFTRKLLFIDGDNKSQVKFAIKKNEEIGFDLKIILVKGNIMDLMKKHKIRLYFDQDGFLTKTFGIIKVPSFLEKEGKKIKIKEIKIN